jgi:NAD(P)-dependent dehydrogenase (short-subunit alcohol dehydrogenase family)
MDDQKAKHSKTYDTFVTCADSLLDVLTNVAEGELMITDTNFSELDIRIGRLRSLLKSIETKDKITDILSTDNEINDLSNKSKYYDQDVSNRKFCYECKTKIRSDKYRHTFYRSMCILCGNINMFKRDVKSDQSDKVAIVTGGRVKIGYETALMLLKNGATVIVTSRFVDDCFERFAQEKDFDFFEDRLHIYQLNMLVESNIDKFVRYVKKNFERVDYLINNAAQTIRRPKEFYQHVIEKYNTIESPRIVNRNPEEIQLLLKADEGIDLHFMNENIPRIADSETSIIDEVEKYFPRDKFDEFGQQLDLRKINSWMLELENISRKEFIEVLVVNVVGPFILCQEFKELMGFSDPVRRNDDDYSWIINVTSMEGIFNWKYKPTRHPQTNIAKAALNMMTRTCGSHYIESGIVVVGVETGWNNSQHPDSYERITPLDCKDGAARILDPIYRRLKQHSVIYKDYKVIDY